MSEFRDISRSIGDVVSEREQRRNDKAKVMFAFFVVVLILAIGIAFLVFWPKSNTEQNPVPSDTSTSAPAEQQA